jgi:hypothetical protein
MNASMPWVIAGIAYTVLAVLLTWPVAAHLSSAFPHDAFDPALNAWILWWNAQAVPLTAHWWNAPSFWPVTGALALSEHLLGITVVSTPLLWLGADPVATYNLVLLLSYPLTALATHGLAFAIVRRHGPAVLAGLIMGFSPYRVAQLPHVQMLWAFGMPLALMAAHRYVDTGSRRWLVALGASWLMLALSNSYFLLFFPVLFAAWILWFAAGSLRRATSIVAMWVGASLPLIPILWTYAAIHRAQRLTRRFDEIESFGADLTAIFTTAPDMILWRRLSAPGRGEGQLFPGMIALALAGAAVALALVEWRRRRRSLTPDATGHARPSIDVARKVLAGLAILATVVALSPLVFGSWQIALAGRTMASVSSAEKPMTVALALVLAAFLASGTCANFWQRRSPAAFYTLAAAAMWALSWGPHPRLAGTPILFRGPYALLLRLPGLSEVRVPARFGMLLVLCLAVAAAIAFARFTAALSSRVRGLLATLAAAAVIAESWPALTIATAATPIRALQRGDLAGPVIELPLGESWLDAPAQFRGIVHGRPVVNGYSGYAPPHYHLISTALRLNDVDVLTGLTSTTPLVVVLNRREEIDRWRRLVESRQAERVATEDDFEIYRLPLDSRPRGRDSDPPLPIRSIEASADLKNVGRLLDGNLDTIWNSERVQAGGEFVILDLGASRQVTALRLTSGPFIADYPRRVAIDCAAGDSDAWTPCWTGSVAGLLLRSVLDDPATASALIPIDRDGVRRLRIRQTAVDPMNGWSIAEIAVLGR